MISAPAWLVTRRKVCTGIAAAGTLAPIQVSARPVPAVSLKPRLIVCDTTFGSSAALAERWQREAGCEIVFFAADVTSVWQKRLHRGWSAETPPLGGITSKETLFCLERLAWDSGQRVLARTALIELDDAALWRWLIGPRWPKPKGPA